MYKRCVVILIAIMSMAATGRSSSVYELIREGRVKEAQEALSKTASAAARDGDFLFFQALLEPDAAQSARLMEASLNASVSSEYREEIHYLLAQYYLLQRDYGKLARIINEYRARWEEGRYREEMLRYSALVDEFSGEQESALRQVDRYLVKYATGESAQWGLIDKARVFLNTGKKIGAQKQLRTLTGERSGPGVAQALYLLGDMAADARRIDDAVFYYNLLRESFPAAVGLDPLLEKLGSLNAERGRDNTAEQVTGTYYSVKVGVFSEKGNAERQKDKFEGYGKEIEIRKKSISGKTYHVVYVGHFPDYPSALQFKRTLEATHGELFQVVAR